MYTYTPVRTHMQVHTDSLLKAGETCVSEKALVQTKCVC